MSPRTLVFAAVSLCAPCIAQGYTLPPGFEPTQYGNHGNGSCATLGAFAAQRVQVHAGDTLPAANWNRMSFRESRYASSVGRSWKNIRLRFGPLDFSKRSTTFSANFHASPTVVFTGGITFPPATAAARPLWGNFQSSKDMVIPFAQTYTHSGVGGICIDFEFSGGSFANSATWTGASDYHIDGLRDSNSSYFSQAATFFYGDTAASCYATGQNNYGYFVPYQRNYGLNDISTTLDRGKSRLHYAAVRLASNTPAIGAVTFGQPPITALHVPGSCQGLYLDLSGSQYLRVYYPFVTDSTGSWDNLNNPLLIKHNPKLVGIRIWSQAAYQDPVKGFEVSIGGSTWMTPQPPITNLEMLQANGANAGNPVGAVIKTNLPILKVE